MWSKLYIFLVEIGSLMWGFCNIKAHRNLTFFTVIEHGQLVDGNRDEKYKSIFLWLRSVNS